MATRTPYPEFWRQLPAETKLKLAGKRHLSKIERLAAKPAEAQAALLPDLRADQLALQARIEETEQHLAELRQERQANMISQAICGETKAAIATRSGGSDMMVAYAIGTAVKNR